MSEKLSDKGADAVEPVAQATADEATDKPSALFGPSTNPATNLIIADIVLRGLARVARDSAHKGMLRTQYSRDKAKDLVDNQSLLHTLTIYGITKVATRSVPGALLIGSGLIAKTLYDRGRTRRLTKRTGKKKIEEK